MAKSKLKKIEKKVEKKLVKRARAVGKVGKRVTKSDSILPSAHLSNAKQGRASASGQSKDSDAALIGVIEPFDAYQKGLKTGLPLTFNAAPIYGMWTRNVFVITETAWGTSTTCGVRLGFYPNPNCIMAHCTPLTASDGTSTAGNYINHADSALGFLGANIDVLAGVYQGVRVRNITPVVSLGGESVIGMLAYTDAIPVAGVGSNLGYSYFRTASTSYAKSNSDPGVFMEMSWIGNADINVGQASAAPAAVRDYSFITPTNVVVDYDARAIAFASSGSTTTPQTYEIEIVTYYACVPLGTTAGLFTPTRYEVSPERVIRGMDQAYARYGRYSMQRCAHKDDFDLVETLKTGAKWVGNKLVNGAVDWVADSILSLFAKRPKEALLRVLCGVPPEMYGVLRDHILQFETSAMAKSALRETPPPTPAQLADMYAYYANRDTGRDYIDVPKAASAAVTLRR